MQNTPIQTKPLEKTLHFTGFPIKICPFYTPIHKGKSNNMPEIMTSDVGSFDVALRRFKRACEKAGIPSKLRQMEFYEKPTSKRKRKRAAAVKRYAKKLQKEQESIDRERSRG